jgi:hypothetical protein
MEIIPKRKFDLIKGRHIHTTWVFWGRNVHQKGQILH